MVTKTNNRKFEEFLTSQDTLRVYKNGSLLFSSKEEQLRSLMEYTDKFAPHKGGIVVFDRVVGNAAALLLKKILCKEVFSELGSENAIQTLDDAGIAYHFNETVHCIQNDSRQDMCPDGEIIIGKKP